MSEREAWDGARENQRHARWTWRHRWDDLAYYNSYGKYFDAEPWYAEMMAEQQAAFDREQAALSPLGHGTPVPEEATLPSGDARVAAL